MIINFLFLFLAFFLISNCNASGLSKSELKEIDDAFDAWFQFRTISNLFRENTNLRSAIVKKAKTDFSPEKYIKFRDSNYYYGLAIMIENNKKECVEMYLNQENNFYFSREGNLIGLEIHGLYGGSSYFIQYENFTPLMLAVALNKYDIVKEMVNSSFKIMLDKPHRQRPFVNARSIARKIHDSGSRKNMLDILKIDTSKHDISRNDMILKKEKITVKQAVIANDPILVDAALFRGYDGDKNNEQVIRWAMINQNIDILEILVIEGYKIPDSSNRPSYGSMNKEDVDYLLDKKMPLSHCNPDFYI